MSPAPVVDVRNLRFRYADGTEALRGVDFRLHAGETVILFGPNGSGKTTFTLHLNGLLEGEGSVTVCGLPVGRATSRDVRRKVGMVFQDAEEQLFLPTIEEDVAYGLLNLGLPARAAREKARKALEAVSMGHAAARAPYHLSAGEKRRVAIAGVLVMEPEILVLDEPTTSLDPPGQRSLAELLATLPQAKIITTHDTAFARTIGTRAVFFEGGRIVGDGSVTDVINRFDWEPHPNYTSPREK